MTREEAINQLEINKEDDTYVIDDEALDMAIKALEQEPCEDCISRQAVRDTIFVECSSEKLDVDFAKVLLLQRVIKSLPSVTPQIKTGHWIMPIQDDGMSDPIYYQVRCSNCGFDVDPQTWHMELHQYGADRYCPNCGVKMVESQERSDKEC